MKQFELRAGSTNNAQFNKMIKQNL